MPLYALFLAALWALPGPVAAASEAGPWDFKAQPVAQEVRQSLEFLGWRFDDKTGRAGGVDGKPLTVEAMKAYLAPYDFKKEPLGDEERVQVLMVGCRLDQERSFIVCLDAATGTRNDMPKLSVEVFRRSFRIGTKHVLLERLTHLLSELPADRPIPPEALARAKAMIAGSPAGSLPAALVKALETPGIKAGQVRTRMEDAYVDSTRFFDGQSGLKDRVKNALPVLAGFNEPRRPPQYFDDEEKRVGQVLRAALEEHYARTAKGRELLSHFRDPDGVVRLPAFLILDLDPRMGAAYNPANKSVVVNLKYFVDGLTGDLKPAERDALRATLIRSPKRFAEYLLTRPEALEAFLRHEDLNIFHELTHARQDRRERLMVESQRGNTPGVINLEYEHEAFLEEMLYLHEKLSRDPASVKDEPWLSSYMQLLADLDKWRDGITANYMAAFPKDAATLSTAQALQSVRVGAVRRLMGENLYSRVTGWMKLAGLGSGSAEIERVRGAHDRRMADFRKDGYPALRPEGYRGIVEVFLLKAHEAGTPEARKAALDTADAYAQALGDQALVERVRRLRGGSGRKGSPR